MRERGRKRDREIERWGRERQRVQEIEGERGTVKERKRDGERDGERVGER